MSGRTFAICLLAVATSVQGEVAAQDRTVALGPRGLAFAVGTRGLADLAGDAVGSLSDARALAGDISRDIADARRAYWDQYPSGPNLAAASQRFEQALFDKDYYYTMLSMVSAVVSRPGAQLPVSLSGLAGEVDGGIRSVAGRDFQNYLAAVNRAWEERAAGSALNLLSPAVFGAAILDATEEYQRYREIRDLAELIAAGVDPPASTSREYVQLLLRGSGRANSFQVAAERYDAVVQVVGQASVDRAVAAVRSAPKVPGGRIADPSALRVAPHRDSDQLIPAGFQWAASDDRADVLDASLVPADPAAYTVFLLSNRRWFTSALGIDAAQAQYEQMVSVVGAERVHTEAVRIASLPRNARGDLADLRGLGVSVRQDGSGVLAPGERWTRSASPPDVLRAVTVPVDDDAYARWLLERGWWGGVGAQRDPWATLDQLEAWHGRALVMSVVSRLRAAPKRRADGYLADPVSLGASTPVMFDALREMLFTGDPRGFVRYLLARSSNNVNNLDTAYRDLVNEVGSEEVLLARAQTILEMNAGELHRLDRGQAAGRLREAGMDALASDSPLDRAWAQLMLVADEYGMQGSERALFVLNRGNQFVGQAAQDAGEANAFQLLSPLGYGQLRLAAEHFLDLRYPDRRNAGVDAAMTQSILNVLAGLKDACAGSGPVAPYACLYERIVNEAFRLGREDLPDVLVSLATTPPSPAGTAEALSGEWSGTFTCAQGETGFDLELDAESSGSITGLVSFYPVPQNPSVPSGRYSVRGSFNSVGAVLLNPDAWVERAGGYTMVGFSGLLDPSRPSISGFVRYGGCAAFVLEK